MLDVLIKATKEKFSGNGAVKVSDRADRPVKSLLKSVSWRIVGTLDTMVISFFITGRISLALSIGSVEVITKTILYYFHERLWAHIHRINYKIWLRSNGKQFEIRRAKQAARG